MGIALSGVALRSNMADADIAALVGRLTGQTAVEIAPPMRGEFDIRHLADVMVLRYAGPVLSATMTSSGRLAPTRHTMRVRCSRCSGARRSSLRSAITSRPTATVTPCSSTGT